MTEHLHYITHTHEAGEGAIPEFECRGDRTSPCHQYPDCECEYWDETHAHPSVPHDECRYVDWMNDCDCKTTCGPDGQQVRSGPITFDFDECLMWEYAEPVVTDEMVERGSMALQIAFLGRPVGADLSNRDRRNRVTRAVLEAALTHGEES